VERRGAVRRNAPAFVLAVAAAGLAGVPAATVATAHPATPVAGASATVGRSAGDGPPRLDRSVGPWAALPGLTGRGGPHLAGPADETGEDAGTDPFAGGPTSPVGPAWTPPSALPAPPTPGSHVDVVLGPHPDDETLSLGVWIADAVQRGDRVIVVCLTDGRSTGAAGRISARLGRPVTRDEIAAARAAELREATGRLGVRPDDVYLAHLDADAGPGGSRATRPEVAAVIGAFAARFPGATFATMSWQAERHPDHLSAGLALHAAAEDGTVTRAVFAVSRLWWSLPSPPGHEVLPVDGAARHRVLLAADAYDRWDPTGHRLAVGWTSVHPQFVALLADPRDRVHD